MGGKVAVVYREIPSPQERALCACEDTPFWESVSLLEKGAEYIYSKSSQHIRTSIVDAVERWLDEKFHGNPKRISELDCIEFLRENHKFQGHECGMILALSRVIACNRKTH